MTATPAFPVCGDNYQIHAEGMTLRQYAAIKLKVPDSGTDWLDDMIRKSNRNELAARAMQIMWDAYDKGYCGLNNNDSPDTEIIADGAYAMADAMMEKQS